MTFTFTGEGAGDYSLATTGSALGCTTDGACLITFNVSDSAGNYNDTATTTITIDDSPPVLSSITETSITSSAATITWASDDSSDSLVNYSTNPSPLSSTQSSASLVTSHSIGISGLTANTLYYYAVTSCNALGDCTTSSTNSFNTTASSGGGIAGGGSRKTVTYDTGTISDGDELGLLDGDSVTFSVNGKDYTIKMDYGMHLYAVFIVGGEKLRLRVGESANLDLDGDGLNGYVLSWRTMDEVPQRSSR